MRRWRPLAPRIRPDQEVEPSGRDLPQHGGDDEPVKWPDDRQISSAKQVVRQYQRGRGDALSMAGACDIHHEAKIQVLVVKSCNKAIRRLVNNRKYSNDIAGAGVIRRRRFQAKRCHQKIAQSEQRPDPPRRARQHFLSRLPRIKRGILNRDAVGIDELRAGEQRAAVNIRIDLLDFHRQAGADMANSG